MELLIFPEFTFMVCFQITIKSIFYLTKKTMYSIGEVYFD